MNQAQEEALTNFNNGLNCAQAVLSAFCEKYGLDKETAYRIAGGFGGGVRLGEVCGAVSGAVLVIGLKYGQKSVEDKQAKAECNARAEEFLRAYREANGSILCRELLGCNLATKEGKEEAREKGLFGTVCVEKIKSAMELLEEMGY